MPRIVMAAPSAARTDLPAYLPQFRAALEEQRRFRIEQLAELPGGAARASDAAVDPLAEIAQAVRVGAILALAEIDNALFRMDSGSFGRCQECGMAIALERLEILPAVARCMACQHTRETRRG